MDVKRPPAPRAPVIHLTSTASYTRPAMTVDLPLQSTHRASYRSDAPDAARRCREAMRTARSHNMVRDASRQLPLDLVDAHDAEVRGLFAGETARALGERAALAEAKAAQHAPAATRAEAALAVLLESQPRMGMRNQLVKTDFTAGAAGGPFPGSQSAYGKMQSESYWATVKNGAGGRLKSVVPNRLAPNGTRLTNHNCAWRGWGGGGRGGRRAASAASTHDTSTPTNPPLPPPPSSSQAWRDAAPKAAPGAPPRGSCTGQLPRAR